MGASYSSEEDGGDDMAGGSNKRSVIEEQVESVTIKMREEGDGMERPPEAAVISDNNTEDCDNSDKKCDKNVMEAGGEQKLDSDKSNEEANKSVSSAASPTKFIEVPEAGLRLTKLPPIRDTVEMPARVSKEEAVRERTKVYPRGSYPPSHRRAKEAKFVPYEPYKGAVACMERKESKKRPDLRSHRQRSVESEVFEEEEKKDVTDWDNEARDKDDEPKSPDMSPELEANYRLMLDIKEKEITRMRDALENSEKQLKIQTKVNEEVKRLLVASVGEDIEARVEFLSQDKARLAADVLEYNNRIASDWERKEELGVESDVWRSKFLASTVIVDDLTRTKQTCVQRMEDLEHAARRLLIERTQLRQNLSSTQQLLDKLSLAFDPTGARGQPREGQDSLAASEQLVRSLEALSSRLLGGQARSGLAEPLPSLHGSQAASDSPAEADLKRLLARPLSLEAKIPDQASSRLAKDARPHLLKLGDMAASPQGVGQFTFIPSSPCNSSVQDV